MSEPNTPKPYYPGLHGLRFFAAASVVVYHGELFKMRLGLSNVLFHNPFLANIGQMAVNFFFVLSGFLITTLLYYENKTTGRISISSFYLRRVLRIWPPYFLCLGLCFFILPNIPLFQDFPGVPQNKSWIGYLLYLTLLPNFAVYFMGTTFGINHLWSIGVEEQFYLIWPWLMTKFKNSILPILTIIVIFIFFKIAIKFAVMRDLITIEQSQQYSRFISSIRIQCMAIGALGSWLHFHYPVKLNVVLGQKVLQILITGVTIFIFIVNVHFPIVNDEIYCLLFLYITLNVALNKKCPLKFSWKGFQILGNISYGMYIYHMIIIYGLSKIFIGRNSTTSPFEIFWHQFMFIAATIGLSYISYYTLESKFISFRKNYGK